MEARPRGRSSSKSPPSAEFPPKPLSSSNVYRAAEPPLKTKPSGLLTKVGEGGIAVRLFSNHFRLQTPQDVIIYDYHVRFEPNVESLRFRRSLIFQNREMFNSSYIFDGSESIKSLHELTGPITVSAVDKHNNENIQITIKPTGRIAWGHPEMMRFYNTQMKRNLTHLSMTRLGRNFFDKNQAKRIPEHSVEVWPGVLTAINEHDGGILMVVNCLNKIIRKETALDILRRIWSQNRDNFKDYARRELAGSIVMSKYNSKTYRIDDIIFDKNPESYLFERKGESINLVTYYFTQYAIKIQDTKQPLLMVNPTDRQQRGGITKDLVLVPELCLLTGMSENMRNDFNFRKELDKHVKLDPPQRMNSLKDFIRKMISNDKVQEEMNQWNLCLEPDLAQITGRILGTEKILMGNRSAEDGILYDQKTGSFEQSIRSESMRAPVTLEYWVVVAPMRDRSMVESYLDMLRRVAGPLGVKISIPKFLYLEDDRTQTYLTACRSIPSSAKLVHVVVPNNNRDRYNTIKRYFCCDQPCPTQILTNRILRKSQLSITSKLLFQMSVKMGAQAWALIIPPKNTMIAGYNTYRDTVKNGHSVGAFVCSTNAEITTWYSRVSYHNNWEEMSCNFASSLKFGLKSWHSINGRFPEKILIYRDGVSEGQIGYVYHNETRRVAEVLSEREDLKDTNWCFTVVNKRANARFFAVRGGINDPVVNPIPGTVIDSVVTRKERYDFYLVSQCVRAGTVNPTMYNIIADNTKWKPIHHQTIAYKLCHLYYNWAGTISVPAPCQYAYKLACLIGTSVHQEPSHALANQLYFL